MGSFMSQENKSISRKIRKLLLILLTVLIIDRIVASSTFRKKDLLLFSILYQCNVNECFGVLDCWSNKTKKLAVAALCDSYS